MRRLLPAAGIVGFILGSAVIMAALAKPDESISQDPVRSGLILSVVFGLVSGACMLEWDWRIFDVLRGSFLFFIGMFLPFLLMQSVSSLVSVVMPLLAS